MDMRAYASEQAAALLDRLIAQARQTARQGDPDSIHDLRVAIRRFGQCLRVFAPLLPRRGVKRLRRGLRRMMELAGKIRNRDIALDLSAQAGVPADTMFLVRLAAERTRGSQELSSRLKPVPRRGFSRRWRRRLRI